VKELPDYYLPIVDLLKCYIDQRPNHFTFQAQGGHYQVAPYVQALQEHDNMLLIEAVSNQFLKPDISPNGHSALIFMGWRFYPESYLPNYSQFIDQSKVSSEEIALKMAQALYFGYGVDDSFLFEIAPILEVAHTLAPTFDLISNNSR